VAAVAAAAAGIFGAAMPASAYFRDTHFDLTYALARTTCFSPEEAHWIASADWMVDQNGPTTAEASPFARDGKRLWHAFGHSKARFSELWARVPAAPTPERRLLALGQFLHFQQDWEAHAGFKSAFGHGLATLRGADPDSLGLDEAADRRMVQGSVAGLCRMCALLHRMGASDEDFDARVAELIAKLDESGLMDDLFRSSDPRWRERVLGGSSRLSREVLARNRSRIEEFLGGEAVPPPIAIGYARGGVVADRGPNRHTRRWARMDENERFPAAGPARLELSVVSAERETGGWAVIVAARNRGDRPISAGSVSAAVVEASTGQALGQAEARLPFVPAGRGRTVRISVPGPEIASRAIAVEARGSIDFDPPAPDWIEAGPEAEAAGATGTAGGTGSFGWASPPRVWIEGRRLAVAVAIPARSMNPERVVRSLEIELDRRASAPLRYSIEDPVWSLVPPAGSGPLEVRTFATVPLAGGVCDRDAPLADDSIRVTLRGSGKLSETRSVALEPSLRLAASRICYAPLQEEASWHPRSSTGRAASGTKPPISR